MNTSASPLSDRIGLRAPLAFAAIILIGFGLTYTVTGTGVGRVLFPQQALGSLVEVDGRVVGSTLMAQPFTD
jgi:K+-transporting ATPase ATPase C chain